MDTKPALTDKEVLLIHQLFVKVVVPFMTLQHAEEDGRSGATLNLRNYADKTILDLRGGTAPEEKFLAYDENAKAKNNALEEHAETKTSWQVHSGDLSQKPYPGGIRTAYDDRFSISGFTWQRDTIGGLWLANKARRLGMPQAAEIAGICGIRPLFIRTVSMMNAFQREVLVA